MPIQTKTNLLPKAIRSAIRAGKYVSNKAFAADAEITETTLYNLLSGKTRGTPATLAKLRRAGVRLTGVVIDSFAA